MGVYTLKDLEKIIPSIASINQMQVKENLQALTEESLIRCEKIGSGNWYWCFVSDAKRSKENQANTLKQEESKLLEAINEIGAAVEAEMKMREEDEEIFEGGAMDRKALLEIYEGLLKGAERLDGELALYSDCDPADVACKIEETEVYKESATKWTDNIESLASSLIAMFDRDTAALALQQTCGDEYVFGEGLKDLSDL